MPAPVKLTELAAGTPLAEALKALVSPGVRVVVVLSARWAPPCKALKDAVQAPSLAGPLAGCHLVFVDIDLFGKELEPLGFTPRGVPELYGWSPETGPQRPALSGNAWGKDTAENIATAVVGWLPQLPAPPQPLPSRSQRTLAILGVLLGLALLVAGAVWQVSSQEKERQDQVMEEVGERARKHAAESIQKALEQARQKRESGAPQSPTERPVGGH